MNLKSIAYWTATALIAAETLVGGARDLGYDLSVVDRDGRLITGEAPARAVLECKPEIDSVVLAVDGKTRIVVPLLHEGGPIGAMGIGPFGGEDES